MKINESKSRIELFLWFVGFARQKQQKCLMICLLDGSWGKKDLIVQNVSKIFAIDFRFVRAN